MCVISDTTEPRFVIGGERSLGAEDRVGAKCAVGRTCGVALLLLERPSSSPAPGKHRQTHYRSASEREDEKDDKDRHQRRRSTSLSGDLGGANSGDPHAPSIRDPFRCGLAVQILPQTGDRRVSEAQGCGGVWRLRCELDNRQRIVGVVSQGIRREDVSIRA